MIFTFRAGWSPVSSLTLTYIGLNTSSLVAYLGTGGDAVGAVEAPGEPLKNIVLLYSTYTLSMMVPRIQPHTHIHRFNATSLVTYLGAHWDALGSV